MTDKKKTIKEKGFGKWKKRKDGEIVLEVKKQRVAKYTKQSKDVKDFIKTLLAKQKEEMLDRLPKRESINSPSATVRIASRTKNQALSQIKEIIKGS